MAIDKGSIKASYNYEVTMDKPFDARAVKPTKASLFDKESWSYDGSSIYIYDGMQVFVEDEKKTYVLVDASKFNTEEGWELLGTGTASEAEQVDIIDKLDSTRKDAALSANQGRILSKRIEEVAGEATKIYSIKGSTKYAELPMTGNKVGDVYNITDDFTLGGVSYPAGTNVVWDGSNWDALGGSIDLSAYAKTEEVTTMVQNETQRAQEAEGRLQGNIATIETNVANKVDKVSGKGLSTEDFTSKLKRKLDELVNYDDEDIRKDIESLQNQLDTLTNSDDLEDVIAKYEELKAFLEGLGNDEYGAFVEEISERIATLEANLKTTNSRIDNVAEEVERLAADKQDVLVSGVNIVTINNETILRRGNLDLATKEYVDDALAGIEGGGGGNANVLVINSDVDFNLREGLNTTGGIINDKNITYAKVKEAVDNGYTIALKEPSGNISYCIKADYAVPNQNGEKRIMLFFSWRIGDEEYAASLYVGLDSSLSYAKWKLDLATKDYVDGAIEDIPSGGGGITEEKEVYIGSEEPTDDGAKLWIDPTGTPNQPSAGVEVIDNLESDSTTAALSANQGRVLKEMIERGGASGGAESPYAMKVFIVPEGVMAATEDAPYTFNAEETEEFLAQGDFKRTIVKYPVQSILGVPQQVIANVSFYVEMDSSNGVLVCGGTEFSYLSTEADGVTKLVSVDHYQTNIQCLNNQGTIMGFGTRNTHTIKNN